MDKQTRPGESSAIASLVLGIISCLLIFVYLFTARLFIGAVAVIAAGNSAKHSGYFGGLRIAGTIVSWVGAVLGAVLCCKPLFVSML